MKKKLLLLVLLPIIGVMTTPHLLNFYRVTQYEERVAHGLSLKTDYWHLPKQIPDSATKVFYDYSVTRGQGSGSNTLRFKLPKEEAEALLLEFSIRYFHTEVSDSPFPDIAKAGDYKTLVWRDSKGDHGAQGGIWYSSKKQEFLFFHENW